ncbi:MAG: hypothetical protein WDN75_19795 [Bacteroidota bacterium]
MYAIKIATTYTYGHAPLSRLESKELDHLVLSQFFTDQVNPGRGQLAYRENNAEEKDQNTYHCRIKFPVSIRIRTTSTMLLL